METPHENFAKMGPFIPFNHPLQLVEHYITDYPTFSICANEDWLPVLTGAIKVLMSDRCWDTDDPDQAEYMREQISRLLSSWEVCPTVPVLPDWETFTVLGELGVVYAWENIRGQNLASSFGTATGAVNGIVTVKFQDVNSHAEVGGMVTSFVCHTTDIGNFIGLTVTDCADFVHVYGGLGSAFINDLPYTIKSIAISAPDDCFVRVDWRDNWTCGEV